MKAEQWQRLSWIDFVLSALAGALTVFSFGMGLAAPMNGVFLTIWILVGTGLSYLAHTYLSPKATAFGGLLYTALVAAALFNQGTLNGILPGEVPLQLTVAGGLAWMITLGSFAMWRDSTMIFQAVPTIALFGLVGSWETFGAAPFMFFGFLLCFAALFARAHSRLMLRQAEDSGYLAEPEGMFDQLRGGPWRWMAGPEWALGVALVVILLSLIGAPVLQASVQQVAGQVRVNVPRPSQAQPPERTPDLMRDRESETAVGQGPRRLMNRPVIETNLRQPEYLRMSTYDQYTGRGWRIVQNWRTQGEFQGTIDNPDSLVRRSMEAAAEFDRFTYRFAFLRTAFESLPFPGELASAPAWSTGVVRPDGTLRNTEGRGREFALEIRLPRMSGATGEAGKGLPRVYYNPPDTTDRVRDFATRAVQGAKNDQERADRLKRAIEGQVTYSLDAPAVPPGADAVDHFLFESKQGYCDLFASAMVVMARSQGLPARYVTGFYPARGVRGERGLILHESEAHAWAEVFLEGVGWVAYDATEGAPNVGEPTTEEPVLERPWVRMMGWVLLGAGVLAFALVSIRRYQAKLLPTDPYRKALAMSYGEFTRAVERVTGHPRRPSHTPTEFIERYAGELGEFGDEARALTAKFVHALYAPVPVDPAPLAAEVKAFAKKLKGLKRKA